MKKVLSLIHFPVFLSGSLVILLLGAAALWNELNPGQVQVVLSTILKPFQQVDLVSAGSSVELYTEQDMLKMRFNITEQDQALFDQLASKLNIGTEWQKGISIGLDQQTVAQLDPHLPAKSTIIVEDKVIKLQGNTLSFLQSGVSGDQFSYASNSASLNYAVGQQGVAIVIEKPGELINEATKSGMMNVSQKIEGELFSLGEKIDRIDLELKGKSLKGEIVLK